MHTESLKFYLILSLTQCKLYVQCVRKHAYSNASIQCADSGYTDAYAF